MIQTWGSWTGDLIIGCLTHHLTIFTLTYLQKSKRVRRLLFKEWVYAQPYYAVYMLTDRQDAHLSDSK